MPDLTLLLPNYNNEHVLPLMFDYLRRNVDCGSVAFVMVDDGSEDNSLRVAKAELSRVGFAATEIIEKSHTGIVETLNAGLAAVNTTYIARIDGDATVETPGWADRLLGWLRKYPEVGLVGGQVLFDNGRVHSFGRSLVTPFGLYDEGTAPTEPVGRRTFDGLVYRPVAPFFDAPPYEVDTLLGVCAGFRTDDARAAGGFDARFSPVWIEDDDFGLAVRMLGRRVVVDPVLKVTHRTSLRGSRNPAEKGRSELAAPPPPPPPSAIKSAWQAIVPQAVRRGISAARHPPAPPPPPPPPPVLEDFLPRETNPWRAGILRGHYATWRDKWGFDPLNPDLSAVFARYWDSPLCWACDPPRRAASRQLLASAEPI